MCRDRSLFFRFRIADYTKQYFKSQIMNCQLTRKKSETIAQCSEMFLGLLVVPHTASWRREIGCPLCFPVDVKLNCVTLQPL